jgi:hypothetical protein
MSKDQDKKTETFLRFSTTRSGRTTMIGTTTTTTTVTTTTITATATATDAAI